MVLASSLINCLLKASAINISYQTLTGTHYYWEKMDTTAEEAAQVVALLEAGHSQRQVAREYISQSAPSRVYRRFQETGAFTRRQQTNRRRCTSERDDRFIVSSSLRNRHLTGVDVQQELRRVRGVTVSEWTVRKRLKKANLTS